MIRYVGKARPGRRHGDEREVDFDVGMVAKGLIWHSGGRWGQPDLGLGRSLCKRWRKGCGAKIHRLWSLGNIIKRLEAEAGNGHLEEGWRARETNQMGKMAAAHVARNDIAMPCLPHCRIDSQLPGSASHVDRISSQCQLYIYIHIP